MSVSFEHKKIKLWNELYFVENKTDYAACFKMQYFGLFVAYADDVALLARSPKALKEIFHKLQNEATLEGLNINEDKT